MSETVSGPHDDGCNGETGGALRQHEQQDRNQGVLLYYKYMNLGEQNRGQVLDWYERTCREEGLRGRIRVALDGVNCTLGGDLAALQRHISGVRAHDRIDGDDIDFKLSESQGPRNVQAALESGFTTLSIKGVKEVVSMGKRGALLQPQQCGRHVSPQEFHSILREAVADWSRRRKSGCKKENQSAKVTESAARMSHEVAASGAQTRYSHPGSTAEAGAGDEIRVRRDQGSPDGVGHSSESRNTILLDVRNVYETSIGHFSADGVDRLDPKTRQFSDLPGWIDDNIHLLRGKRILMYCTGGVRCEKASALIREGCDAAEAAAPSSSENTEILQLAGGIERYLQAYPCHNVSDHDSDARVITGDQFEITVDGRREYGSFHQTEATQVGAAADSKCGPTDGAVPNEQKQENGFFHGKNFVFDERVAVPERPAGGVVVGRCVCCERSWDDYGSRTRCSRCRMLLLLCNDCIAVRGVQETVTPHLSPSSDYVRGAVAAKLECHSLPASAKTGDGDLSPAESCTAIPQPSSQPKGDRSVLKTVAPYSMRSEEGVAAANEALSETTERMSQTDFFVAGSRKSGDVTVTTSAVSAARYENRKEQGTIEAGCMVVSNFYTKGDIEHRSSRGVPPASYLVCPSCRARALS